MAEMKEKLKALLKLQTVDEKIKELRTKLEAVPLKEKELQEELERARARLEEKRARHREMIREQNRKNFELQEQNEKLNKYKAQRFQVKTNEAYAALEREIENTLKRCAELEDEILNLMISIEAFEEEIKREEKLVQEAERRYEEEMRKLKEFAAALKAEIDSWVEKRNDLLGGIDPDLLRRYEEWLNKKDDFVLSIVEDNVCGRCFLAIPPQTINELKKGEKLITCSSCGRILIWKGWLDEEA
ncbi:hypothetical protein DRP77_06700 [Candidatus Poribacteria bacterium]|nr:MAG: hypothetical protein DRP77_06700 [Candidatus Poribacteria bacterium]